MELPIFEAAFPAELSLAICFASLAMPAAAPPMAPATDDAPPSEKLLAPLTAPAMPAAPRCAAPDTADPAIGVATDAMPIPADAALPMAPPTAPATTPPEALPALELTPPGISHDATSGTNRMM